jgi:hypothetical protein
MPYVKQYCKNSLFPSPSSLPSVIKGEGNIIK